MAKNHYETYFLNQAGSGIGSIYAGSPHMRGFGVADFLRGILRSVFPFIQSAGRAVAGEAARAGLNVVQDVTSGAAPFRESVKRRMSAAGDSLQEKLTNKIQKLQTGSGYKKRKLLYKGHLNRTVRPVQSKKGKAKAATRKTLPRDIFTN